MADATSHDRLNRLEARLANVTARLTAIRHDSTQALGAVRAAVVLVAGVLVAAAAPKGTRVMAPFTVVDDSNIAIFEITEAPNYGVTVYDAKHQLAIVVGATGQSSFFRVVSPTGLQNQIVMGQSGGTTPAVHFRTNGIDNNLLSLAVDKGKPALNMGHGMVNMTQAEGGGGLLQLGGANGTEKVGFLVGKDGVGVVRAQPVGNAGVNVPRTGIFMGTGLPSTIICGIGCFNP